MNINFNKSIVTSNNNKVIKYKPKLWDFREKKYKESLLQITKNKKCYVLTVLKKMK